MIVQTLAKTDIAEKTGLEAVFHSKILLFGEYGIIKNSMGLSIPYYDYSGALSFITDENSEDEMVVASNLALKTYAGYLWGLRKDDELLFDFDLVRFENDVSDGLYFNSSIPQGFGVGSSGALCAALYNQYAINKIGQTNLSSDEMMMLKKIFAQMESFYHGKSSGFDPLICYLNVPVLVESKSQFRSISLPENKSGGGSVFLLNTGNPSETEPLVKWFGEQYKESGFVRQFKECFIPYNDACITQFLTGETQAFFTSLYKLSKFLFEHFNPMIPEAFKEIWLKGLETGAYNLKLCGSGGGGYLLGFTQDFENAKKHLPNYNIKEIYRL